MVILCHFREKKKENGLSGINLKSTLIFKKHGALLLCTNHKLYTSNRNLAKVSTCGGTVNFDFIEREFVFVMR